MEWTETTSIYIQIGFVLFAAAFATLAVWTLESIFRRQSWYGPWSKLVKQTIHLPLLWLIWGAAVFISLEMAFPPFPLFHTIRVIYVIAIVTWVLLNAIKILEKFLWERATNQKQSVIDKTLSITISRITSIIILVVASLYALDALGMNLTAILAFGGIGGIAVSWAAKDVIANFFGGLMIFLNRPFTEGDWIKSTNKNFEGIVEQIGWYMTRIRTLERRPTFIPNALITDAIIENPGRMYHRRILQTFSIRYQDIKKAGEIVQNIKTMLQKHPEIDTTQNCLAHVSHFGESSIDIDVYCFTNQITLADFRNVQQDVLLGVAKIIEEAGAAMPFPTRTLYMQEEKKEETA